MVLMYMYVPVERFDLAVLFVQDSIIAYADPCVSIRPPRVVPFLERVSKPKRRQGGCVPWSMIRDATSGGETKTHAPVASYTWEWK
jgi:hypothetical protein